MGNTEKFDMIASQYDTAERQWIAKLSAQAIEPFLEERPPLSAMEFGCGTGLVGLSLASYFDSILFVDTSEKMLEVVEEKIKHGNLKNASTSCFDLESAQVENLKVDVIFMAQVLLHIEDTNALISKLYTHLNDKGLLIIVDFDENENVHSPLVHSGFNTEQLIALMTNIGYGAFESKTFYRGEKIFMGENATMFILKAQKTIK